ncbi:MAG: hypothetical protein IJP38_06190 [Oscillospiraceae bacterium]|nr:hypothetical protein [Oscillospiraceae bacterium]
MKQKKWKAITSAVLLAALVVAGALAIAAEYGTSEDPLVSLSYINNVLAPQISEKVDEIIAEKTGALESEIDSKINSISGEIDDKLSEYTSKSTDEIVTDAFVESVANKVAEKIGSTQTSSSSTFALVKLNAGQTLTAKVGCEILLRIGTATCVSSGTPGLIDMTTGGDLAGGKSLEKNHLYLCTVDGRGVKATSNITVLVRGPYSIS